MITGEPNESYGMLRKHNNHPQIDAIYVGLIQDIKNLINDAWDYVILVDGYEGSAKSSFALNLAADLDPDILDNIGDHVFYDIKKMTKAMWESKKKVFVIDEAIDGFFSRESMSKTNITFGKTLATVRDNNHVLILVIPNPRWLDAIARDHRIKLRVSIKTKRILHKVRRGFCTIKSLNVSEFDGQSYNNFEFNMRFPDFPRKIKGKYLELKRKESYRAAMLDNEIGIDDPILNRNTNIYKLSSLYGANNKRKVSNKEIAEIYKISDRQVRNILKDIKEGVKDAV